MKRRVRGIIFPGASPPLHIRRNLERSALAERGRALAELAGAREAVADPGHRQDEEWMGWILFDLLPQVLNMDVDDLGLYRIFVTLHVVEDFFVSLHFVVFLGEEREQ